eukprot:10194174-Prorocentrum_lima.AAC.1
MTSSLEAEHRGVPVDDTWVTCVGVSAFVGVFAGCASGAISSPCSGLSWSSLGLSCLNLLWCGTGEG